MKEKKNNIHTVLLTGANGGLGLKLADKISEHCKKLLLFGRNKKSLLKLKKKLEAKHTSVIYKEFPINLNSKEGVIKAINLIKKENRINVLINCAAKFSVKSIIQSSYKDLTSDFHLNFFAPFMIAKECSKKMLNSKKGVILNIGSSSSYTASPDTAIYSSSKHALLGMSRAFQIELGSKGIRSIFVAPGSIQTKMGKKVKNQDYSTFIEPENLADFLLSLILQDNNMIINEVKINRTNYKWVTQLI